MSNIIKDLISAGTRNLWGIRNPVQQGDAKARLSLSVLKDDSGSMEGNKQKQSKQGLVYSLDHCPEDIEVGLITFGGKVSTLSGLTYDHNRLKQIVNSSGAKGKTPMLEALKRSYKDHILKSQSETSIVLFTDGKPTVSSLQENLDYARKIKEQGTKIVTVGFGEKVNERFLIKLASSKDNYYFAEAPIDIFKTVTEAIGSLVTLS